MLRRMRGILLITALLACLPACLAGCRGGEGTNVVNPSKPGDSSEPPRSMDTQRKDKKGD